MLRRSPAEHSVGRRGGGGGGGGGAGGLEGGDMGGGGGWIRGDHPVCDMQIAH